MILVFQDFFLSYQVYPSQVGCFGGDWRFMKLANDVCDISVLRRKMRKNYKDITLLIYELKKHTKLKLCKLYNRGLLWNILKKMLAKISINILVISFVFSEVDPTQHQPRRSKGHETLWWIIAITLSLGFSWNYLSVFILHFIVKISNINKMSNYFLIITHGFIRWKKKSHCT